jgi:hypothetical protein
LREATWAVRRCTGANCGGGSTWTKDTRSGAAVGHATGRTRRTVRTKRRQPRRLVRPRVNQRPMALLGLVCSVEASTAYSPLWAAAGLGRSWQWSGAS